MSKIDSFLAFHASNEENEMKFILHDGGRVAAGYKGAAGDCVVRAIAIATEQPYKKVYDTLFSLNKLQRGRLRGRSPRDGGTSMNTIKKYLSSMGWNWIPTMRIGSGCKVHLRKNELPMGRLIVRVSKHLVAVIDGVIYDTYNPSRCATRCVYGYWSKK
jgi:hypothetical protein